MSTRILLTGFAPYRNYRVNSSLEAVLVAQQLSRKKIHAHCLPVEYRKAHDEITGLLERIKPDVCLLTGQYRGCVLRLEKTAVKPIQHAAIPGYKTRHSKWPLRQALRVLNQEGFACRLSGDAGRYVCESTCWSALDFRVRHGYPVYLALLHVPLLSAEWPADRLARAMLITLDTIR